MNKLALWIFILVALPAFADDKVLRIYHDANWVNSLESAQSIWQGMHVALAEEDYTIQGYRIEPVKKNHSANVKRSRLNLTEFLNDPNALLVMGGTNSPPLIKNRQYINENNILTLVPWAAGAPITRHPSDKNWIFRLSVDDAKAGEFLINYAKKYKACERPHLLLVDNLWGESNLVNMQAALQKNNQSVAGITRFGWGVKAYAATNQLLSVVDGTANCVVFVGSDEESAHFFRAMGQLKKEDRLPIVSHWGISTGHLSELLSVSERNNINLEFLQTCFSFLDEPISEKGRQVFMDAQKIFPNEVIAVEDIQSPVGFIHAYDLTRVLIAAMKQVQLTDDMLLNREKIRLALENLREDVPGLLKVYQKPFSVYSSVNYDAHEALKSTDYCMAKYDDNDNIVVIPRS